MKANKYIKKCGPFEVVSISQDGQGVRLKVYPAFPQYNLTEKGQAGKYIDQRWKDDPRWPIHRYAGHGGGPSIFTAIALAQELENFLNQPYTQEQVDDWKATNVQAFKKIRDKANKAFEKAMRKIEKDE